MILNSQPQWDHLLPMNDRTRARRDGKSWTLFWIPTHNQTTYILWTIEHGPRRDGKSWASFWIPTHNQTTYILWMIEHGPRRDGKSWTSFWIPTHNQTTYSLWMGPGEIGNHEHHSEFPHKIRPLTHCEWYNKSPGEMGKPWACFWIPRHNQTTYNLWMIIDRTRAKRDRKS